MARRRSKPDRGSAGRSAIVAYRQGEKAIDRHFRRRDTNLKFRARLHAWCERNGFTLRITNEGHHWQMTKDGFLAEWWPSSAKLVIDKRWDAGIHCHDYQQAEAIIEAAWRASPMSGSPCKGDSTDAKPSRRSKIEE